MRRMLGVGTLVAAALGLYGVTARADERAQTSEVAAEAAVQDVAITTTIKTELLASADLGRLGISVGTSHGVVTLTGTVPSDGERRLAVDLARRTHGVSRVDDQLRLIGSTPADPEVPQH